MPQPISINPLGIPFIELQSVDSTNNYARQLINDGMAHHGAAIFAHEQFAGKGQRSKTWITEKNANIALSVIIKPSPLQIDQQFQLSICIAAAACAFFQKYAGDETKIKWPNDLYWRDRKAGGILIENIISANGNWSWSVVGIGINVNQTSFSPELKNPVSLKQITGKSFDPVMLAKELCSTFENYFQQLINGQFENIYSSYLNHLYKKNEKVKLKQGSKIFEAIIKNVSPSGKLIVQHAIEEEFTLGEIEWLI